MQAAQQNQKWHDRDHNAYQYFLSQQRDVLQSHRSSIISLSQLRRPAPAAKR
jgi:hypothetical protein